MLRKLLSMVMLIAVFVATTAVAPVSRAGAKGLVSLWSTAQEWVNDPKKLFRDYSVDYFVKILEKK